MSKKYKYMITVTAEELIANGEGVAGGNWPKTIIRNGLKYGVGDGRGNQSDYHLCFEEMLDEQAEEIATLKAALSASSEKLAEARKVIRNEAAYCEGMIDFANSYAVGGDEFEARAEYLNEFVASWDSADDSAAESEGDPLNEIYDMEDAAQYLGISKHMMVTYVTRQQRIRGKVVGNSMVFTRQQLDTFKETMRKGGRPSAAESTPKYKVGDRVRIKSIIDEYPLKAFDTVIGVETGADEPYYALRYWDDDKIADPNHHLDWRESQLIPYNESEEQ